MVRIGSLITILNFHLDCSGSDHIRFGKTYSSAISKNDGCHPNFLYNTIEIPLSFIAHYGSNLKPNLCQSWKKCTLITPSIISVYE